MSTTAFDLERLAAKLALITAYDEAVTAIVTGATQSYSLDTGQTRQVVTKLNLTEVQRQLRLLEEDYRALYRRIYGGNTFVARPC